MPQDLAYVIVFFALFVIPKFLQRFRLPSAISSLLLGVVVSLTGIFESDSTLPLLGTLGIVTLFLFAGIEVNFPEMRKGARILSIHLGIQVAVLALISWLIALVFSLELRPAVLVALALLTPSAGFILDSLDHFGLSGEARFWTKSKAISAELLALGTLFVVMQSSSAERLLLATGALVGLVTVIPFLFRLFAERISPFAPRSEFAFLLMMALVCAFVTRKLGVYYLVGAFLVGIAAQRFRSRLPAMSSENMLHAIEAFASVFAPFYFFFAGVSLRVQDLSPWSLLVAAGLVVVFLPLRTGIVFAYRRLSLGGEELETTLRVSSSLLPTLVFTLVLAQILREQFQAPSYLFGGLMLYAIASTLVPSLMLHTPPPEYESPHICQDGSGVPCPEDSPTVKDRASTTQADRPNG